MRVVEIDIDRINEDPSSLADQVAAEIWDLFKEGDRVSVAVGF